MKKRFRWVRILVGKILFWRAKALVGMNELPTKKTSPCPPKQTSGAAGLSLPKRAQKTLNDTPTAAVGLTRMDNG